MQKCAQQTLSNNWMQLSSSSKKCRDTQMSSAGESCLFNSAWDCFTNWFLHFMFGSVSSVQEHTNRHLKSRKHPTVLVKLDLQCVGCYYK